MWGLVMEDVVKFYGDLVNFLAIWNILWPFGIFSPVLLHFTSFGMLNQETSGNPAQEQNPTNVSYKSSVVNFYNPTGSLTHLENKNILLYFEQRSSLLCTTLAL
jgi:hypothetical protein